MPDTKRLKFYMWINYIMGVAIIAEGLMMLYYGVLCVSRWDYYMGIVTAVIFMAAGVLLLIMGQRKHYMLKG